MLEEGWLDQLHFSHDGATFHDFMVGDPVFADEHADYLHVANVILPQLRERGVPDAELDADHGRQPAPLARGLTSAAAARWSDAPVSIVESLAIDAFAAALGADKVLTGEDELREFRDPFQYEDWDDYSASAVVMPTTVEEVQAVVRVANEHASRSGRTARARTTATAGRRRASTGSVIV